jgi:hypothetical protein
MPTTTGSGQIVMNAGDVKPTQPMTLPQVSGSIAQAAAAKTAADTAAHVEASKALGAGQKGSGRRTRRGRGRKMRGGDKVQPVNIPTAGSVPGQNPTNVGKGLVELLAQTKASRAYDGLTNATPMQVKGGFRMRGAEDLYPGTGTESQSRTKGKSKTKKKHGRRHRRTRRGKHSKHHTVRRRRSRRV